jgi:hypothetical protein
MKLSELVAGLKPDEYFVATNVVFIYQKQVGGVDILKQVLQVDNDLRIISQPPAGCCKVVNLYWDPDEGKVAVEFEK